MKIVEKVNIWIDYSEEVRVGNDFAVIENVRAKYMDRL
jgi:hypothetical protein